MPGALLFAHGSSVDKAEKKKPPACAEGFEFWLRDLDSNQGPND